MKSNLRILFALIGTTLLPACKTATEGLVASSNAGAFAAGAGAAAGASAGLMVAPLFVPVRPPSKGGDGVALSVGHAPLAKIENKRSGNILVKAFVDSRSQKDKRSIGSNQ